MANVFFVLNNRFSVDASLNLLTNHETGLQTRLEPRLIEILHLLATHEGKLVSRETLVSKIWDNYGGADDALNQAISILRKALLDADKQIIETVPKKGYILHALVTDCLTSDQAKPKTKKAATIKPVFLAMLTGIAILFFALVYTLGRNNDTPVSVNQPPLLAQPDSMVSKNWHGKNYTLVIGKSKKIQLYENDIQIADSKLKDYAMLIQELKDKLASEQDAKR